MPQEICNVSSNGPEIPGIRSKSHPNVPNVDVYNILQPLSASPKLTNATCGLSAKHSKQILLVSIDSTFCFHPWAPLDSWSLTSILGNQKWNIYLIQYAQLKEVFWGKKWQIPWNRRDMKNFCISFGWWTCPPPHYSQGSMHEIHQVWDVMKVESLIKNKNRPSGRLT